MLFLMRNLLFNLAPPMCIILHLILALCFPILSCQLLLMHLIIHWVIKLLMLYHLVFQFQPLVHLLVTYHFLTQKLGMFPYIFLLIINKTFLLSSQPHLFLHKYPLNMSFLLNLVTHLMLLKLVLPTLSPFPICPHPYYHNHQIHLSIPLLPFIPFVLHIQLILHTLCLLLMPLILMIFHYILIYLFPLPLVYTNIIVLLIFITCLPYQSLEFLNLKCCYQL